MSLHVAQDRNLLNALRELRIEVVPVSSVFDEVSILPQGTQVTVTCSSRIGIDRTFDVAVELARQGFRAVPHIPARQVPSLDWLQQSVDRLVSVGIDDALVLGGDASPPAGPFTSALELLHSPALSSGPFQNVGIAGYPEGHPVISDDDLRRFRRMKSEYATYIVTQLCFSTDAIRTWLENLRADGLSLPVYLGTPGYVPRERLMRVASRIGVGDSIRFLRKNPMNLLRLMFSSQYDPTDLINELGPLLAPEYDVAGFHVFSFNAVARTEQWRQEMINRMSR
jgi:methylenetetrahydrofolate reductase (NADPH)